MPTEHTEQDTEFVIPEGAGLPSERSTPVSIPPRGGDELLNAAAAGADISPREHDDLVDYYLANGELPGDTEPTNLSVKLGRSSKAREFRCIVHPITWDEWQDARERATNERENKFDTYVLASWCVARSLIEPQLGPVVMRMQRDTPETAPADAAELLRRMFRKQSGALLDLHSKVLELSGLQEGSGAVREVDAAKN